MTPKRSARDYFMAGVKFADANPGVPPSISAAPYTAQPTPAPSPAPAQQAQLAQPTGKHAPPGVRR